MTIKVNLPIFTHESESIVEELNGALSDPEQHLLLEQCIRKIALDLEAIKSQLEFACKKGVIVEHSRLLIYQAKENIENMLERLNKMGD